jgi:hypothetical protein
MARQMWRGREITPPDEPGEPDLGPDERDRDLLDGTWEQDYYGGHTRTRDWRTIGIGIALLALLGLTVPMVAVLIR